MKKIKNIYELRIAPYLSEIQRWKTRGDTNRDIAVKLSVSYSSFRFYLSKEKDLKIALEKGKKNFKSNKKNDKSIDITTSRGIFMNPRSSNGNLRRKHRARLKALGGECGICKGRLGPIHYDEPSDSEHPLSFVIDEIRPVSKWKEFGYASARAAAEDWENLQAAHYCCNASKGNKTFYEVTEQNIKDKINIIDGDW